MALNFYVGWTGEPWRTELLSEPSAPGNYKDPAKISAYVEEKRVKQQRSARSLPIYGRLESVFVCDDSGERVFSRTTDDIAGDAGGRTAGLAFLDWLRSTFIFPEDITCTGLWSAAGSDLGPVQLVGFDIKTALKMAAMEGFIHPHSRAEPSAIPRRIWHLHHSDDFAWTRLIWFAKECRISPWQLLCGSSISRAPRHRTVRMLVSGLPS